MAFYHLKTLGDGRNPDLCVIRDFVEGVKGRTWQVQNGERLAPFYPQDAMVFMDRRHKGIKLSSLLGATGGILMVHKELKELIEKHCQGVDIEYLPFTLYDHRKRVASRDYFIINPIGTFDCLDFEASDIKWDKDNPKEIISIRKHVLDRKKVEKAPQLFRIDKDTTEYVLGVALATEIHDRKLTNIVWNKLPFSDEKQ
jgi:hypothetical protein